MNNPTAEILIISGGSELVSLAIAEAAWTASMPYAVFSLVPNSILRDAPGCTEFHDLSPFMGNWDVLRSHFLKSIKKVQKASDASIAIFPSEDGSLRLLNEWRDDVLEFGEFSRARTLRMGGIDKAEVIERLEIFGLSCPSKQARVVFSPSEAKTVFKDFGSDVVFKPALKPLSMDLSGLGRHGIKVITQFSIKESTQDVIQRLENAWPISERWIAQPRLQVGPKLERSVCTTRGKQTHACQVAEQAKYPRMGGTALWVKTEKKTDLIESAISLLEALDVVGICETSYLPDKKNNYRFIELNPRPWLQVGLIEFAGFPIISTAVSILRGTEKNIDPIQIKPCEWVHAERTALALISGQLPLQQFLSIGATVLHKNTILGGYSTRLPNMRARIATRSIRKVFS